MCMNAGFRTGKNDGNCQRIRLNIPISCSSSNVALQMEWWIVHRKVIPRPFLLWIPSHISTSIRVLICIKHGILNLAAHFYRNSGYCSTGMICPLETCLLLRFCVVLSKKKKKSSLIIPLSMINLVGVGNWMMMIVHCKVTIPKTFYEFHPNHQS
jgi:hypothetical protein